MKSRMHKVEANFDLLHPSGVDFELLDGMARCGQ